jgi:hypothetical protein
MPAVVPVANPNAPPPAVVPAPSPEPIQGISATATAGRDRVTSVESSPEATPAESNSLKPGATDFETRFEDVLDGVADWEVIFADPSVGQGDWCSYLPGSRKTDKWGVF